MTPPVPSSSLKSSWHREPKALEAPETQQLLPCPGDTQLDTTNEGIPFPSCSNPSSFSPASHRNSPTREQDARQALPHIPRHSLEIRLLLLCFPTSGSALSQRDKYFVPTSRFFPSAFHKQFRHQQGRLVLEHKPLSQSADPRSH